MELDNSPLLLIDGMNVFMRHYAANPTISSHGTSAGGLIGTMNALRILCDKFRPEQIIVVWEGGGSARRRNIFHDYKMHRKPVRLNRFHRDEIPDTIGNRDDQVRALIGCLKHTGICQLYIEDCEADDVIAQICIDTPDRKIIIVSADKDYYQLLDDKHTIYNHGTKTIVTANDVKTKYNITPVNFAVAKAICGDISDNINGIKGAGFKVVAKRFPQLGNETCCDIDEIIEFAKTQLTSKLKIYSSVVESADLIRRNIRLIKLDGTMLNSEQHKRIHFQIKTFEFKRNKITLIRTLNELGLNAAMNIDVFFRSTSILNHNMKQEKIIHE